MLDGINNGAIMRYRTGEYSSKRGEPMPHLEAIIGRGNFLLLRDKIDELRDIEIPTTGSIPDEIFEQLELATPEEIEVLNRWPEGTRAVLRAALYSAIKREPDPIPVTLAWVPAYDYDITVSEARGVTGTTMTVLLPGPYEKVPAPAPSS